ncbi:DUF5074 domain-containing protein [Bacteroides sp.]
MKKLIIPILLLIVCFTLSSCRGDDEMLVPSTGTQVQPPTHPEFITGFYLLNEGNMGSNKCTLDFMDYTTGYYHKNIYAETNPSVVMELGDVGNDIQIYGKKLYAVINCSHFIEVMDKKNARHLGTIDIPNCRYITFHEGYAYVSSYAGPVQIDPNARLGYVAKVDTATLQVIAECAVGYQPEEMAIVGNKLYVANSGGYRVPNYDRTVSVIDLNTFTEMYKIDVAINLHRLKADRYGNIYVSSRGDYYTVPSNLYVIDTQTDEVTDTLDIAASELWIDDDYLYLYSTEYSYTNEKEWEITYALIDTRTKQVISRNFITDGTEKQIKKPYGIAVNPETKEFFVTDAKDYVSPGTLYCFTPQGKKKWSVTTGDIPAHFVFVPK